MGHVNERECNSKHTIKLMEWGHSKPDFLPTHQLNMPVCFWCTNHSYSEITSEKVEDCSVMTALVKWPSRFMAAQCHPLVFIMHCKQSPETSSFLRLV